MRKSIKYLIKKSLLNKNLESNKKLLKVLHKKNKKQQNHKVKSQDKD